MKSRIKMLMVAAVLVGLLHSPLRAQMGGFRDLLPMGFGGAPVETGDPGGNAKTILPGAWYPGKGGHAARGHRRIPRPARYWVTGESLLWFGKGRTTPALITTSPQGTIRDEAGVLGEPGTEILFGGGNVGDGLAAGARLDFGFWLDPCETLGVGAKIWGFEGASEGARFSGSDGNPILARPFFNVNPDFPNLPGEDSLLVVFPGLLDTGSVTAETTSDVLGTEAYLRASMLAGRGYNLDLMGGYHFVQLNDGLLVSSSSIDSNPGALPPVGTIIDTLDAFDARNAFHGGQIGFIGEIRYDCWTFSGLAKISVGNMHQAVRIDGSSTITQPGDDPVTSAGGLLAQPTNMSSTVGPHSRDRTAMIPEVGVNVSYRWREHLRLTAGYSAIYWSNVVLAGDQIDRNVNLQQNPLIGPPLPAFAFQDTDYWMHGLNLGVTLIY
jgi:hypothetical protein